MFAQQICDARVSWDDPLSRDLMEYWERLWSMLRGAKSIMVPGYLCSTMAHPIQSAKLVSFCDTSSKAYAAITYLKLKSEAHQISVKCIASQTCSSQLVAQPFPDWNYYLLSSRSTVVLLS